MTQADRLSDLAQAIRVAAMAQGRLTTRQAKALADDLADLAGELRLDANAAAEARYQNVRRAA